MGLTRSLLSSCMWLHVVLECCSQLFVGCTYLEFCTFCCSYVLLFSTVWVCMGSCYLYSLFPSIWCMRHWWQTNESKIVNAICTEVCMYTFAFRLQFMGIQCLMWWHGNIRPCMGITTCIHEVSAVTQCNNIHMHLRYARMYTFCTLPNYRNTHMYVGMYRLLIDTYNPFSRSSLPATGRVKCVFVLILGYRALLNTL